MSASGAPRANRLGQACPSWCTQEHDRLVVDGKPEFGYLNGHSSDYMPSGRLSWGAVKVSRLAQEETTKVRLDGAEQFRFSPEQADALAELLEDRHSLSGIGHLIDELRAAAQIARDTDGGAS